MCGYPSSTTPKPQAAGWYYHLRGQKMAHMATCRSAVGRYKLSKSAHLAGALSKKKSTPPLTGRWLMEKSMRLTMALPTKVDSVYRSPAISWSLTGTGLMSLLFWHEGDSPEAKGASNYLREKVAFGLGKDRGELAGKLQMTPPIGSDPVKLRLLLHHASHVHVLTWSNRPQLEILGRTIQQGPY